MSRSSRAVDYPLSGKSILVTGGSKGIGRETAVQLVALGAEVWCVGRSKNLLEEAAASTERPEAVHLFPADLSIPVGVESVCELIRLQEPPFYGMVSGAGCDLFGPFTASKRVDWDTVFELNVFASMSLGQAFAKKARHDRSGGVLIVVASAAALVGVRAGAVYAASKAALVGWARSVAIEWAPLGVRVNAVCPGWTKTDMYARFSRLLSESGRQAVVDAHPLGLGDPQSVGRAIARLVTPEFDWMTGSIIALDGGYTAI